MRDRPSVVWLILAFVVAVNHRFIPESRWLMVHLVMLGAVTHSAMVWSTHFTQALLKSPESIDPRKHQTLRLAMLFAGVSSITIGVPTLWWWLVVAGACLVVGAVCWHAVQLGRRLRAALPGRFRITIRYYLLAAACVPVGATLGVLLARGPEEQTHAELLVAHSMTMVLGWLGFTVLGTLVTLGPTILRTRIDAKAEAYSIRALPFFAIFLATTVTGALLDNRPTLLAGLFGYVLCVVAWAVPLVRAFRGAKQRREFAAWSTGAGVLWLVAAAVTLLVRVARDPLVEISASYGRVASMVVVGFALQLVTGALSYLIPSVVGGGPRVLAAGRSVFEKWSTARLVLINGGLLLCVLPVPSAVRVVLSVVVLLALAAFIPLMFRAIRSMVRTRIALATGASTEPPAALSGSRIVQALSAALALAVAVVAGIALNPVILGGTPDQALSPSSVVATGRTTTVQVTAHDMHFVPKAVQVPAGNRLVVVLTNRDTENSHDLTFTNGKATDRLRPGQSQTLDVGVVGASTQGWCSVLGHRRMGMVFDVVVTGKPAVQANSPVPANAEQPLRPDDRAPRSVVDASLPPASSTKVHRLRLPIVEQEMEVAPGIKQKRWTFGGTVPGPTLRGRIGDTFEITLVNQGSMGHSIDFHAGSLAPDRPMRTIAPGQSLVYRFTATRAGIWMYHCSTMPMSMHIAAGMHGAVIIDPPNLPTVDREYVLVQSEAYVNGDGRSKVAEVDGDAVSAEKPDLATFNGIAGQYDHRPLTAKVGERVRIWVLNAGPNRGTSFHVVGGQYDRVYFEGNDLLNGGPGGAQSLALAAAQGGFVELTLPEAGNYPFVSHVMVDAERGAHGILRVSR